MERMNDRGIIKINKHVFGRLIWDAVGLTEGKAFSASEKGKLLTGIGGSRPAPGELADHMMIREQDDIIEMEFCIIMSFGASIQKYTSLILDYLETELKAMFPWQKGRIVLRVVGVKSKQIAPRDIEVERTWN